MISPILKRLRGILFTIKTCLGFLLNSSWISFSSKILIDDDGRIELGENSRIWEYSKVLILKSGKCLIGKGTCIERGAEIIVSEKAFLSIGDNTGIGSFCNIRCDGRIKIGDNVLIAQFVSIVDGLYEFKSKNIQISKESYKAEDVSIGNNVWIGVGVVILPRTNIGDGAVIGAGSIVTKDIAPYSIVVGNPARSIGYRT